MYGDAVRAARLAQGLTQTETAKRLRKSRIWLYKVEKGTLSPSMQAARDLVQVLQLAPSVFLGEPPEGEPMC
jgi:transcriptional regulator with XRE-family HTH domain